VLLPSERSMRVLTYNIAGNKRRGRPEYVPEVARLILECGADVVGLQEVVHFDGDPHPPEIELAELTGMHAEYLPAHRGKGFTLGNAVLCRDEIQETVYHDLPHAWPERRVLLEVKTTAHGLPVTVFCTHLVHGARFGARIRLAQATAVAKQMQTCWRPHILVGDLNASPHSKELHPVRTICVAQAHFHRLRTWPARRPMVTYDHIWPGPGWEVESILALDAHLSDHRPVVAQLGWRGAPRYNVMPDPPGDVFHLETPCKR
jgi:endonuclease/exonuclease/phosphatase family metal-dependent hydrolase